MASQVELTSDCGSGTCLTHLPDNNHDDEENEENEDDEDDDGELDADNTKAATLNPSTAPQGGRKRSQSSGAEDSTRGSKRRCLKSNSDQQLNAMTPRQGDSSSPKGRGETVHQNPASVAPRRGPSPPSRTTPSKARSNAGTQCGSTSTLKPSEANQGREPSIRIQARHLNELAGASSPGGPPPPQKVQQNPARVNRKLYDIGTKVYMEFADDGWFWGEVFEWNSKRGYRVAFEDGDRKWFRASEMRDIVKHAEKSKPSPTSVTNLSAEVLKAKKGEPLILKPNYHGFKTVKPQRHDAEAASVDLDGSVNEADGPKSKRGCRDEAPANGSTAPGSSPRAPPAPTTTVRSSRTRVVPTKKTTRPARAPGSIRVGANMNVTTVADSCTHVPPAPTNELVSAAVSLGASRDSTASEAEPPGWLGSMFRAVSGVIPFPWSATTTGVEHCPEPAATRSPESNTGEADSCERCFYEGVKLLVTSTRSHSQDLTLTLSSDEAFESKEFTFRKYEEAVATISDLLDRGKIKVCDNDDDVYRPVVPVGSLGGKTLVVTQKYTLKKDGREKIQLSLDWERRGPEFFRIALVFCPACGRLVEFHWNGVVDPLQPPVSSAPNVGRIKNSSHRSA